MYKAYVQSPAAFYVTSEDGSVGVLTMEVQWLVDVHWKECIIIEWQASRSRFSVVFVCYNSVPLFHMHINLFNIHSGASQHQMQGDSVCEWLSLFCLIMPEFCWEHCTVLYCTCFWPIIFVQKKGLLLKVKFNGSHDPGADVYSKLLLPFTKDYIFTK